MSGLIISWLLLVDCGIIRSSSCQPSQPSAAMNSDIATYDGMLEGDDQQQDTMPHYDQPEKIVVSHACIIVLCHTKIL